MGSGTHPRKFVASDLPSSDSRSAETFEPSSPSSRRALHWPLKPSTSEQYVDLESPVQRWCFPTFPKLEELDCWRRCWVEMTRRETRSFECEDLSLEDKRLGRGRKGSNATKELLDFYEWRGGAMGEGERWKRTKEGGEGERQSQFRERERISKTSAERKTRPLTRHRAAMKRNQATCQLSASTRNLKNARKWAGDSP